MTEPLQIAPGPIYHISRLGVTFPVCCGSRFDSPLPEPVYYRMSPEATCPVCILGHALIEILETLSRSQAGYRAIIMDALRRAGAGAEYQQSQNPAAQYDDHSFDRSTPGETE